MRNPRPIPHNWNLIKHTNVWLKLAGFKHRLTNPYTYYRQREALKRFRHCKEKKPSSVIRKEIRTLKRYWGFYPMHYFRHDFYRADCPTSLDEMLDYIPEVFFSRFLLDPYSDNKYSVLVNQKCMTAIAFKALNIPQPMVLGSFMNGNIFDSEDNCVTSNQWVAGIKRLAPARFLIKPSSGQGGKGIILFIKKDNGYYSPDELRLTASFIDEIIKKDDFLVQEGVEQYSEIAKIYPESVNTFRMVTENLDGKCRLTAIVMRIGHDGSYIDNFSQNGIVLGIDKETGQANETARTERGIIYSHHPNTNYRFGQFSIPNWSSVKNQVLEYSQRLAMIPYIGWDVALTDTGPVILEANSGLGPDLTQMGVGGLRKVYKIDDPKKFWKRSPKYRVEQYEKYAL